MNDINYIVKYLSMLRDDSISINNLTNEFCIQICKDLGITRTDELENIINTLLTSYKSGEIDENAIIKSFENMLNTSDIAQNSVSNNSYVNKNISNANNVNTTLPETNENDVTNIAENNSFDNSNINGSISSVSATINKIDSNNDNSKESIGEKIIANTQEFRSNQNTNNFDEAVYDIDTDIIGEIVNQCSLAANGISDASISVPGLMAKYASGVVSAAVTGVNSMVSSLNGFKGVLLGVIAIAGEGDIAYNSNGKSWNDNKEDVLSNKGPLVLAGDDFFESMGYKKDASGNVKIGDYEYNPSTKMLYYGDTSVQVEFYIPTSVIETGSDGKITSVNKESLTKKNTVTMLAPHNSGGMSSRDYFGEYKANSVIITPIKDGDDYGKSYIDLKMEDKVVETTKFAKAFTEQKDGCKNYIAGVSSGGYSAFNIGASNVYDGTVSINSSIQLPKQEHGISEEGLQSYAESGKPVLCIESASDTNDNPKKVQDALKKIDENYPEVNARWTTNRSTKVNTNSDRFLGYDTWCGIATNYGKGTSTEKGVGTIAGEYYGHGAYDGMAYDVVNLGILDGNEYNNGLTFDWDTLTSLEPTEFYKDVKLN